MIASAHADAYVDPFDRVCHGLRRRRWHPSATTAWEEQGAIITGFVQLSQVAGVCNLFHAHRTRGPARRTAGAGASHQSTRAAASPSTCAAPAPLSAPAAAVMVAPVVMTSSISRSLAPYTFFWTISGTS